MGKLPKVTKVTSLHQILVAEDDTSHFGLSHPTRLPIFASPLVKSVQSHSTAVSEEHVAIKRAGRTAVVEAHGDITPPRSIEHGQHADHADHDEGEPPLNRSHESSTIQLFYDLFFVANLTTFTGVHEINSKDTLKSYVGFFGMLWFTWFQVALFDIRFGNDSVFERICKALQFGIMVGFAVVGPNYESGWEPGSEEGAEALQAFKTLSLILMVSRLLLSAQYAAALLWLKGYKKAYVPMLIHIGVCFTASMIYLGLYFSFSLNSGDSSLIAWYITIAFEAVVILAVSGRTRFLSLRHTCIVERLGLLTLIILGEGVIGLCASVVKVGKDGVYSADVIGMLICAVCIIYFLWMLYFDQVETQHVGTVRQQIWTILHFPFHVGILLVVEGISQFAVWRKIVDILFPYDSNYYSSNLFTSGISANGTLEQALEVANETLNGLYDEFPNSVYVKPNLTEYFSIITDAQESIGQALLLGTPLTPSQNETLVEAVNALNDMFFAGLNWVFSNFGIEPPANTDSSNEAAISNGISNTYVTVFEYFFTAAGCVLVVLSALFWFGKREKVRADYIAIAVRLLVGTGLATLVVFQASPNTTIQNDGTAYLFSPWLLPTVVFAYGLVVLVDNLIIEYVRRIVEWRRLNIYGQAV